MIVIWFCRTFKINEVTCSWTTPEWVVIVFVAPLIRWFSKVFIFVDQDSEFVIFFCFKALNEAIWRDFWRTTWKLKLMFSDLFRKNFTAVVVIQLTQAIHKYGSGFDFTKKYLWNHILSLDLMMKQMGR